MQKKQNRSENRSGLFVIIFAPSISRRAPELWSNFFVNFLQLMNVPRRMIKHKRKRLQAGQLSQNRKFKPQTSLG